MGKQERAKEGHIGAWCPSSPSPPCFGDSDTAPSWCVDRIVRLLPTRLKWGDEGLHRLHDVLKSGNKTGAARTDPEEHILCFPFWEPAARPLPQPWLPLLWTEAHRSWGSYRGYPAGSTGPTLPSPKIAATRVDASAPGLGCPHSSEPCHNVGSVSVSRVPCQQCGGACI